MPTPAIYVSDIHVHDYKAFGHRDRLGDTLKVIDDTYKLAAKTGSEFILFSGDMYDAVKFIPTKAINRLMDKLREHITANPQIVWLAITGNHDFATKNLLSKPTVSALSHIATAFPDNFIVIDNSQYGNVLMTDWIVMGIPNYEFPEHFKAKLEEASENALQIKQAKPNIQVTLMIHQSPEGQDNPNVRTQTNPNDPLYDVFDMVLCGDIHTSQRINEKFLIGGNPLHKDLTDAGKEKGIYKMDLENPTAIKFVSRKGRYPEFIRAKRGAPVVDDPNNFIIQDHRTYKNIVADNSGAMTHLIEFGSNLPKEQLLENYWKEVDGKDKERLRIGLQLIK